MPKAVGLVWAVASLVGGILIALPDAGPRIFSLSRKHGPSAVDGVGIVLLLVGAVVLDAAIIIHRRRLSRMSRSARIGAMLGLLLGVLILVPTLVLDLGRWWMLGVALLAGVQVGAAVVVSRGD